MRGNAVKTATKELS